MINHTQENEITQYWKTAPKFNTSPELIFYSGYEVIGTKWHITTMYAPLIKTEERLYTSTWPTERIKIIDVVYWEHCDLTVALVDCKAVVDRHIYWRSKGFKMDYDAYIPHITLEKGNKVDHWQWVKQGTYHIGNEYMKFI